MKQLVGRSLEQRFSPGQTGKEAKRIVAETFPVPISIAVSPLGMIGAPLHRYFRTVAIFDRTGMLVEFNPGVWLRRSNSSFTCGRKIRQCVEPPKWNMPS